MARLKSYRHIPLTVPLGLNSDESGQLRWVGVELNAVLDAVGKVTSRLRDSGSGRGIDQELVGTLKLALADLAEAVRQLYDHGVLDLGLMREAVDDLDLDDVAIPQDCVAYPGMLRPYRARLVRCYQSATVLAKKHPALRKDEGEQTDPDSGDSRAASPQFWVRGEPGECRLNVTQAHALASSL